MGERAKPWPISILMFMKWEEKLFQTYCVLLLVGKEPDNTWIYTNFLEDERKKAIVKKRKELYYVKDEGAGWYIFDPFHIDEMS